ncbi:MAG: peptidase dimerization domain protein, partial [Bacteroidota bacterium]
MMSSTKQYVETHLDRFLDELMDFLRIPSVGTSKQYAAATRQAAEFVQQKLIAAGAEQVRLIDTIGYPLVYGERVIDKSLP